MSSAVTVGTPGNEPDASPGVSFVLTSCGRFDLLQETLASFLEHNTWPIAQYIIVEDSGSGEVADVVQRYPIDVELIVNATPKGQMGSLDAAYGRVRHPLIFHCEDDWRFLRPGLIEDSMVVLDAHPEVTMVSAIRRGVLEDMDEVVGACPVRREDDVAFRIIPPDAHELWFGYSFNPGLRRTADYRALGAFANLGHESDLSLYFKRRGRSMAVLEEAAYTHIGEGRHVEDRIFPINRSPAFMDYWKRLKAGQAK